MLRECRSNPLLCLCDRFDAGGGFRSRLFGRLNRWFVGGFVGGFVSGFVGRLVRGLLRCCFGIGFLWLFFLLVHAVKVRLVVSVLLSKLDFLAPLSSICF